MARFSARYASDKQSAVRAEASDTRSIIFWICTGFILLFLLISPYHAALFNGYSIQWERAIYSAITWSSAALFALSIRLFYRSADPELREGLAALVWGMPLAYLLSFLTAASVHQTSVMLYLNVMYAAFFSMAVYFTQNKLGSGLIQWSILLSGYSVIIYTFMNMFGNAYYMDAVTSDQGLRLTSVFQYANAYAAFLLALLPCCLHYLQIAEKWYVKAIHATMLVPLTVSFLLTLSRGGLVVLPFAMLAILPLLPLARQLFFFIYFAIGLLASLLVTDKIRTISAEMLKRMLEGRTPQNPMAHSKPVSILDPLSAHGWLTLLSAAFISGAVLLLFQLFVAPHIERGLDKLSRRRRSHLLLPGALCIIGIVGLLALSQSATLAKLLPTALQHRVESINLQQHSVQERFTMFKDAVKLFKEFPVFGGGGGVWNLLHTKIQSAPYIPRQAHSFYLQYLDETGIVGMALLILLFVCVFYFYLKKAGAPGSAERDRSLPFYIIAVTILMHSALDFEMSFGYIAALVFLCLGGMAGAVPGQLRFLPTKELRFLPRPVRRASFPLLLCAVSVTVFCLSALDVKASTLFRMYQQQMQQNKSAAEAMKVLDAARKVQPSHPDFTLEKIRLMTQQYQQSKDAGVKSEAEKLLAGLKKKEPYHTQLFESEYALDLAAGDLQSALAVVHRRLESDVWGLSMIQGAPNWYERDILLNFQLGFQARSQKSDKMNKDYWDGAQETYLTVLNKIKQLDLLPKEEMHEPFTVTPVMALRIAQIAYMRGDVSSAENLLKPYLNEKWDDTVNLEITEWYLAASIHQNKKAQELYSRFIAKYPDEAKQIAALAADHY